MSRLALLLATLAALIAGGIAPPALAQAKGKAQGEGLVNKLLAPGPLMLGHKDLEHGDCLKCHDAGQGVPNENCLACHTPIKKSIQAGDSFHANQAQKKCISCHSDHKGRNFDSTVVNQSTFNHALTGFRLRGAHAGLKCVSCHTEKRTAKLTRKNDIRFFGKDDSCVSCHKKDDVHFFPPKLAAKDCGSCHNETSWKSGATFNHQKETGYALLGTHASLKCSQCHAPSGRGSQRYSFPQLKTQQCLTCHKDQHGANLSAKFRGGNCVSCHTQQSWKITSFNHAGVTGFALKGRHSSLACASCHKPQPAGASRPADKGFKFVGQSQACVSCHKDYHGYGPEKSPKLGALAQCQSCHTEAGWKVAQSFNHNADTRFAINGRHVGVKCFDCHKPKPGGRGLRTYDFPQLDQKTCETCHTNPHRNNPSPVFRNKCTSCHTTEGWKVLGKTGTGFNHNTMTRFPLTGDHAKLTCAQCHTRGGKEVFKFANPKGQFCDSCHKSPHAGQFQEKLVKAPCADCHDTVDFRNYRFDHDKARFLLTGKHKQIEARCIECHKPTAKKLPNTRPPKTAHNFQLPHADKGFCLGCHKNVHKDQFSSRFPATECTQCHTTQSFTSLLGFDHDKTRFKIQGTHVKFKDDCVKCHVKTDKMLDTNPPKPAGKFQFGFASKGFCESCHTNVHKEQFRAKFSTRPCTECHTQVRFDRRLPFDHDKTSFKLTGTHAKFSQNCAKCHVPTDKLLDTKPPKPAGKFRFANQKTGFCESCHTNEHKGQFSKKFAEAACRSCHLTGTFHGKQRFNHDLARFLIKGKHQDLRCQQCHIRTKERFKAPPKRLKGLFVWDELLRKDCATCHADPHKGRFGPRCSECHTEEGWGRTAEYHKNLMLSGTHMMLECAECHTQKRRLSGMGEDCQSCHAKDDPHMGSQPNCAGCHTQQFWSVTRFHHSLTSFPLRGAHRLLDCQSCHAQGVYQGLDTSCASCHFTDAAKVQFPNHKTGGFESCEQCHNQFAFPGARP